MNLFKIQKIQTLMFEVKQLEKEGRIIEMRRRANYGGKLLAEALAE